MIIFHNKNLKKQSLNDLSILIKDEYGIVIKKQSLHDRFNENALAFLETALETMLQKQLNTNSYTSMVKGVNSILIKDSVCFQIDESLADDYPGSGGAGSKASVRIQFEYDILNGKINDLSLNAFNDQDAKNSIATIESVDQGNLIIRDLAYMSIEVLKAIVKKAAFYLCRLNHGVKVYTYDAKKEIYKEINFKYIHRYMKKHGLDFLEKEIYLGKKEKMKTRLIMNFLPEEAVEKRLRKARQNNKKKSRKKLSKEYIARAHLNLFITNADMEQIPTKNAWPLYRLRWQIELVFKIWKSICDIEKVKKVKKYRLECFIYSKLIFIVLGWQVIWNIARQLYYYEGKVLSFYKAFKTLVETKLNEAREVFMMKKGSIKNFIENFYDLSRTFHILEKKQNNQTSLEILLSCSTV